MTSTAKWRQLCPGLNVLIPATLEPLAHECNEVGEIMDVVCLRSDCANGIWECPDEDCPEIVCPEGQVSMDDTVVCGTTCASYGMECIATALRMTGCFCANGTVMDYSVSFVKYMMEI